jgi:hypothetical protein
MTNHPNTTAAGFASGAALLLVYVLHRYFQVEANDYWKAAFVAGAGTLRLYIGRDGIKGTALRLWAGAGSVWRGKPAATK